MNRSQQFPNTLDLPIGAAEQVAGAGGVDSRPSTPPVALDTPPATTTASNLPRAASHNLYSASFEVRPKERIVWKCLTELDARGRPPPHPVEAIRAALNDRQVGERIYLRTKSRPSELLMALARLGIPTTSTALPDLGWRTIVQRP